MSVELLQTLSLISYVLAGLMLLVTLALFFYLRVPALWGEVTGRTAKKAIRAMKWKGEDASSVQTPETAKQSPGGTLHTQTTEPDPSPDTNSQPDISTTKERTPLIAPEQKPPLKIPPADHTIKEREARAECSPKIENSPQAAVSLCEPADVHPTNTPLTDVLPTEAALTDILPLNEESNLLRETDLGQTAVLPNADSGLTDLLPGASSHITEGLHHSPVGETTVLHIGSYGDFVIRTTGELPRLDDTTLLDQKQITSPSPSPIVFFEMEKELAFTDSTEIIE